MSKVVLVCMRSPVEPLTLATTQRKLTRFLEALRPDNLPEAPTQVVTDSRGLFIGSFNPVEDSIREHATYAGWLAHSSPATANWWQPRTPRPDGAFALLRGDSNVVEALADFSASRTLWYGHNEQMFVVSTSQRAIPWFLGSFTPNYNAVAWLLSSGSLGPGYSWDERARPLGPASRVCLDRRTWQVKVDEPPVRFIPDTSSVESQRARLSAALKDACEDLNVDWSKWILPLSGGNDCRAILMRIANRRRVRTVTWGLREALETPGTDAYVAHELAQRLGLAHEYLPTDMSRESPERVLDRFLVAGDGRVDHIAGYTDGFDLWRRLNRDGVVGIVRGDHGFGRKGVRNMREASQIAGLTAWSEYPDMPAFEQLGLGHLGAQQLPAELVRKPDESAPDWRDRLVHTFSIPDVLAALTDLKAAYVEVANPLLTQSLVEIARSQPARLRMDKKLFRKVSEEESVPVRYATRRAVAETTQALNNPRMAELLRDHAQSREPRETLSPELMDLILSRLPAPGAGALARPKRESRVRRIAKRVVPRRLRAALMPPSYPRRIPAQTLALRTYLITRMHTQLARDGRSAD